MIDTIKLTLDKYMFTVIDKKMFEPETTNALRNYSTLVQNPTKSELKSGLYKPRLTITNRFNCSGRSETTLSVELSLPKLLFGNNFDELNDNDFLQVVELLQLKLKEMGVLVYTHILENAPVSAIHYSKNISLTDGSTPRLIINKIKEANIPLSLDVNQTDYRNDGQSYKWHSNSYEVAFYDKIHDLDKARMSEKRSEEDDNALQLNLFEKFKQRKQFEVLRMEARLNNRQKTGKLFRTLGIESNLTFEELFNSTISKKVLLYYINEIEKQRLPIFDCSLEPKEFLASLIVGNPTLGLRKTFQIYGFKQALEVTNIRELRTMFEKYNSRNWYRLISEVKRIKLTNLQNPFTLIHNNLNDFVPLKLVDFQDKMINNDKYK